MGGGAGRRGGRRTWVAAAAVVAVAVLGCKGQAPPPADREGDQERLNLLSNPALYLDTGEYQFDDDAADYEQLLALTVTNKSRFVVHGLEGDVTWLDEDGRPIGTSHITASGTIPAYDRRTFSTSDGTLTSGQLRGGALRVAVAFTKVSL
jgi:hypothetical protein